MIFSRIRGQVAFYNLDRHFGKIAGEDGTNYIVRGPHEISTADVYGRRFLLDGEHVEFTPRHTGARNEALAVTVARPPQVYDASYREDAIVTKCHPKYKDAFARRRTGDSLFVSERAVITLGALREGVQIRFKPEPPEKGRSMWQAAEVEIYQ
jgi:hypothetical protein